MFKNRLFAAFAVLAFASVVQGVVAWSALKVADQNVQRGRVANELLVGFTDLQVQKQRLRLWLSELMMGKPSDERERDRLKQNLMRSLDQIDDMAQRAVQLNRDVPEMHAEHKERQAALAVLRTSLTELGQSLQDLNMQKAEPQSAEWMVIARLFDAADGQDLRTLLAESITRERLATSRDRAAADASLRLVNQLAVGATLMLTLLAVMAAVYFSRMLSKPLNQISAGARALEQGDLQHRIPDHYKDEFGDLARSVNRMAAELWQFRTRELEAREQLETLVQQRTVEVQEGLHRLEKLDLRRRQLFADISHELKTPTTAIRGEAEIALRGKDKPSEEYKDALGRIVDSAAHLTHVIEDLLTLARSDIDALMLDRTPCDPQPLVLETIKQCSTLARKRDVHVELTGSVHGLVLLDEQRFKQLLGIVLDNAIQYSHQGGRVQVWLDKELDSEQNPFYKIVVNDDGIGIDPQDLDRVFERHFRGELAKMHRPDGHGLGLPLAAALVRTHHGQLTIAPRPVKGTQVELKFPMFEQVVC